MASFILWVVFSISGPIAIDPPVSGEAVVPESEGTVAVPTPPASDAAPMVEPAAADSAESPDSWQLRYQFTAGQQFRYRSTQETTVDAQYRGSRKTDVSRVEQQRLFTVESLAGDASASLVMQFEHVRMQIQSDDREPVVFDSAMAPGEVPALFQQTAHRLKGSAARYQLTELGTAVAAGQNEGRNGKPDPNDVSADAATFLVPLPEQPVQIGDSWSTESIVKVRLTEDVNRDIRILKTFRLKEVKDGIAVITFDSSIMSKTPGVTVQAQLIQATPRGRVEFDIARGLMRKREIRFDETVLGALGPESILASWGNTSESLVDAELSPATSSR